MEKRDAFGYSTVLLVLASIYAAIQLGHELHSINEELNITAKLNPEILIFNRVPKVGSQTINHLFGELRHRNNFHAYTSINGMPEYYQGETAYLPDEHYRNMTIHAIMTEEKPMAFLKHQNFLNFPELGYPSPIYINFVRDPVERIISWYYYVRAPWYQIDEDKNNNTYLKEDINMRELKTSLEDCIRLRMRGCYFKPNLSIHNSAGIDSHASQMTFFCGHDKECDVFNGDKLFKKAVENVEKYFAVVGVLEDLDKSLYVLEKYIPRYFAGAREVYNTKEEIRHVNKNIYKPKTADWVREAIRPNVSREIEFFHFCRQRLHKQFEAIRSNS